MPGDAGKAAVFGDLEGATAASLANAGRPVSLVRRDGPEMGSAPPGAEVIIRTDDEVPLPEASVELIVLVDALEYAIDDTALLHEVRRILRPGGMVVIRVPRRRRIDWLDARNIYHYLRETTRRGEPLPEMAGGTFRRHYALDELTGLLEETGLMVGESRTGGLGLSEVGYLAGAMLLGWLSVNPRVRTARRLYGRWDRAESRWPAGSYYLTVVATRPDLCMG